VAFALFPAGPLNHRSLCQIFLLGRLRAATITARIDISLPLYTGSLSEARITAGEFNRRSRVSP
jgi:hypothetical protein